MSSKLRYPPLWSKFFPTVLISWLTGIFARARFPLLIQGQLNQWFVSFFSIDMSEAGENLAHFRSIEDLFIRRLRPGLRPVASEPLVSPCDGTVSMCRSLDADGQLIQAKDFLYSPTELLGLDGGHSSPPASYGTIYLAPHNYHRVHSPVDGRIMSVTYIRGELWPVNRLFVQKMPKLFVRNERAIFAIDTSCGGRIWLAMVGALNVGRIRINALANFETNGAERRFQSSRGIDCHILNLAINKGDEIGAFLLGSTVVMVMDREAEKCVGKMQYPENTPIILGQPLLRSRT